MQSRQEDFSCSPSSLSSCMVTGLPGAARRLPRDGRDSSLSVSAASCSKGAPYCSTVPFGLAPTRLHG